MSSSNGKSGFDINETQDNDVINQSSLKNETDFSQDPSFSNLTTEFEQQKDHDESQSESEESDDDVDDAGTYDIKVKLIYNNDIYSEDHLFYVNRQHKAQVKNRAKVIDLKNSIEQSRLNGNFNNKDKIITLKELEKEYVKSFVKRVKFDTTLPQVEPLPDNERLNIYFNKTKNQGINRYKTLPSEAHTKALLHLKRLRRGLLTIELTNNKYIADVKNYLYHKEREYKEKYMILKTSEEMENDKKFLEKLLNSKKLDKPWIQEMTTGNKKQLMYTKAACTDDQLYWVDILHSNVKNAKWKLFELKQIFHEAIATGIQENISSAEKIYRERERDFINEFVRKVEYDKSLPMITPMHRLLQKAIYSDKEKIYTILYSTEQADMLKEMKALKTLVKKMKMFKNTFTRNVANDLYHKEFEYKKRFLIIDPETEKKVSASIKTSKFKQGGFKLPRKRKGINNQYNSNTQYPQRTYNSYSSNQRGSWNQNYGSQAGYNNYHNQSSRGWRGGYRNSPY